MSHDELDNVNVACLSGSKNSISPVDCKEHPCRVLLCAFESRPNLCTMCFKHRPLFYFKKKLMSNVTKVAMSPPYHMSNLTL